MFHTQFRLQSKYLPEWIVQQLDFCLVKNHQSICIEVHIDYKFCDWRTAKYTVTYCYTTDLHYTLTLCACVKLL